MTSLEASLPAGDAICLGQEPEMPEGARSHMLGTTAVGMELSASSLTLTVSESPVKLRAKAVWETWPIATISFSTSMGGCVANA